MKDPYLMCLAGPLSRFRVVRHQSEFGDMVFLHNGHATMSFSPEDALSLSRGLLLVASGTADLATTEEALRLEAEAREARARRSSPQGATPTQTTTHPAPKLEDL